MATRISSGTSSRMNPSSTTVVSAPGVVRPTAPAVPENRPENREVFLPPRRPNANFIPSAEQIQELITRGRAALSRGIFWDRGSIINVLL